MARLDLRLSDTEKASLEAQARTEGLSLSEYVRRALRLSGGDDGLAGQVEGLEKRVSRLEEMAGL